jgi:hypothetical protein
MDMWDLRQRWRQRWTRWQRHIQRRWEAWCVRRQTAQKTRRERMQADGLVEQALARAVLDKSSKELRDALIAEVWAQHHEELLQQALEQVHQEQRGKLDALEERLRGRIAEERHAMEAEAEQLIAEGIQQGMAEERQEFTERRTRLRAQRDEWKARATEAEAWIVDHVKELLPDGRRVLLRDPELTKFRLHTLNLILSRFGLEVRARLTDTPQVVACEVGPQHWEQRSRFRLVTVAPGVIDAEDEDEDAGALTEAEASQDGTTSN